MRRYQIKLLCLLIVPILAFVPAVNNTEGKAKKMTIRWAVQKTSTIQIQGATNISSFGCNVAGYYQTDTIHCSEEVASGKPVTLQGALEVNIQHFDCHNKMLTSDLRKTLKADEYPILLIRFLSLERTPVIQKADDSLKGWVEIELAGSRKKFEVNYIFTRSGPSCIQLNGKRSFSFADFKLTPPRKMGGLIKVKDKFNVDFNLLLQPVE